MITRSIAIAIVIAFAGQAEAGKKKPAHKASTKTTAAKGFYKILVKPDAKWVLHETIGGDDGKKSERTITVETYDVRKVGDADVARLRWTLQDGKDKRDIGSSDAGKYTQLAVTPAGLYILTAEMDDTKIAARLKDKPSRSDPPKVYAGTKQNQGRYLMIDPSGDVCMGEGPMPGAGECPDTCDSYVCIHATNGVVSLVGNWAPGADGFASMFAQPGFE